MEMNSVMNYHHKLSLKYLKKKLNYHIDYL